MKLLRKILGGISLTAAMFVFQACYGTEPYCEQMGEYIFHVVDDKDGTPIPDVCVEKMHQHGNQDEYWGGCYNFTNADGICRFDYCGDYAAPNLKFRFKASSSDYEVRDTIITDYPSDTVEIVLHRIN